LTKQWHGGKGSKTRPTDRDKYNDNWDRIFNKGKKDGEESKTATKIKKIKN